MSVSSVLPDACVTVKLKPSSWEIRSRLPDPLETTAALTLVTLSEICVASAERLTDALTVIDPRDPVLSRIVMV